MIRVIGAGVGRTGTMSLQKALQDLLNGDCYHMFEVGKRPKDISIWKGAAKGRMPDWKIFLSEWSAVVDWPAAAYWEEISDSFPDALIILSLRDPEDWWQSASNTIFQALREAEPSNWRDMVLETFECKFTTDINDKAKCVSEYKKHNLNVKRKANPERLLEWHPKEGWPPICRALNLPIPKRPFPHLNDKNSFQKRILQKDQNKKEG